MNECKLEKELVDLELKFGGKVKDVVRNVVSKFDPRSKKQIKKGGMIGGDRMSDHEYAPIYSKHISDLTGRKQVNTLLEFGILKGTGLAIWCEIFKDAKVYGLDVDFSHVSNNYRNLKELGAFSSNEPIFSWFDQFEKAPASISRLLRDEKIDILIDDGYHSEETIVNTIESCLKFMDDESLVFIEDNDTVYERLNTEYSDRFEVKSYGNMTVMRNF